MRPLPTTFILSLLAWTTSIVTAAPNAAAAISKEDADFFEKSVRPVLVEHCYSCHSAQAQKVKGKLLLDTREGVAKGGDSGPAIVAGDPDKSRLIQAVRWTDADLQMPPKKQLSPQEVAALERWVRTGAPDPREGGATAVAAKKMDVEAGRKWWAFQTVAVTAPPAVKDGRWAKTKVDSFVLAKLREGQLEPSPAADARTLVRRAYLDLTGLRPTYAEVEAFANDAAPDAYERLIDRLLTSSHYGERWGRYWLDVVRYGEDNFTGEATTPPFPFAWRFRDWVIDAVNKDVPYDKFVKLQLAADLIPGTPRRDLVALGFLGAAPQYHKDGRLSKQVVETLYGDDWDERVDTVSRGLLGLSVSCARCHDHKFDPIPTSDYYSMVGVFASTVAAPRPLAEIDPAAETKFMAAAQRIFYLSYVANLLRDDPGTKVAEARVKVKRYTAEMERIRDENAGLREKYPEMYTHLAQLAKRPSPYPGESTSRPTTRPTPPPVVAGAGGMGAGMGQGRFRRGASTEPLFQAVYDAGFYIDGSDPDFTMTDVRPGQPRDMSVLPGGNVAKPGATAPRGFLTVLSKGDPKFHEGSGRKELADRIFGDAAALSARVIVNRVWGWHFGKPLVSTPSDFGLQGDRPTHPELLDDLAARFIQNGYSMKWLHREIMLSAAYRQSSRPREDASRIDPANKLLWRMNPRRLDVEAYRDCLLQASGDLDERTVGGPSADLDQLFNTRRTVYGRISRGRASTVLQLFDFPEATMHSPQREVTTTPLQQLFVMNGQFVETRAESLASSVAKETDVPAKARAMYRRALGRDPTVGELQLAQRYLDGGATTTQLAQALLSTNEVIFWP